MKKLIHQFNLPKGDANAALDDTEQELMVLAEGIDIENMLTQSEQDADGDDNDEDDEGQEEMSTEACTKLDASMQPVKLVLMKVSPLHSFCMPSLA